MKTLALALLVGLVGCSPGSHPGATNYTLVCMQDGHETYRAITTSAFGDRWIYTQGSWWNRTDDQQYRPSLYESCHTE